MRHSARRRVYALVEVPPEDTGKATFDWFDVTIAILIVLDVLDTILMSVPAIESRYGWFMHGF